MTGVSIDPIQQPDIAETADNRASTVKDARIRDR
jgi:hypothetical protein